MQKVRAAIDVAATVAESRTLIVITHRLRTVVDSDQIVVLDHGQVFGTGTHSELVSSTPLCSDLASTGYGSRPPGAGATAGQATFTLMVCQPVAPSGAGGARASVWV